MSNSYIFGYKNGSFTQAKSFQLILNSIQTQHRNVAIIVNNTHERINIEELLRKHLNTTNININCFSIPEFIDLHFRYNINDYIATIDYFFKAYLYSNKTNTLRNLLYGSPKLRRDFLKAFFSSPTSTQTQLELDLFSVNTTLLENNNLAYSFEKHLSNVHNIKKEDFYKKAQKHFLIKDISQLFFINPILDTSHYKEHLERVFNYYKSITWIINKDQLNTISWIQSINKNTNIIDEDIQDFSKLPVHIYSSLNEEVHACVNNAISVLNTKKTSNVAIIIPESKDYKEILEKTLIKAKVSYNAHYNISETLSQIKSFVSSCIIFLKKPFSLESLYELSSNSYCKLIKIIDDESNTIELFNIHEIILLKQKIHEKFSFGQSINSDFDFINHTDTISSEKKEKIKRILENQKSTHKRLHNISDLKFWFLEFQDFLDQFSDYSELKKRNPANQHIKRVLETIGSSINMNLKLPKQENYQRFIFDSLIESIDSISFQKPSYKSAISIYSLKQARYLNNHTCFVIGFSNKLYQPDRQSYLFNYLFNIQTNLNETKTNVFQENFLRELQTQSNSFSISMSKIIEDVVQLPSIASNIKFQTKSVNYKQKIQTQNTLNPQKSLSLAPSNNIKALSVSQLDNYNSCPYKFWLEHVLKLSYLQPEREEISASHWGTFIHQILNNFNKWLITQDTFSKKLSLNKITDIANDLFNEIPNKNLFWKTKFTTLIETKSNKSILEQIIDIYETNSLFCNIISSEQSYSTQLNGLLIKGTIDALFKSDYGDLVLDYKTGKTIPTSKDIELLRSLQLPIYFLCLKHSKKQLPQAGIYFQISNQDNVTVFLKTCTKNIKEEYLAKSKQRPFLFDNTFINQIEVHLNKLIQLIKESYFSAENNSILEASFKNRKKVCQFCNYKISCRYSERMSL